MAWLTDPPWDDWDENAHDTEYDPPPGQLEAAAIRQEVASGG